MGTKGLGMSGRSAASLGPTLPARFRVARDLRSLTQTEAVARMTEPISSAALSQIESGKTRPHEETVRHLAVALDVPVGFFSAPMPGDADQRDVAYFRDLRSTSVRLRRRAQAMAIILNDLVGAIERHARLPDFDLQAQPPHESSGDGIAEEAALWLRRSWSLGDGPIPHLVREVERRGVPVARLSLGAREVDAFSIRLGERPLIMLTDDKSSYVRSRFDAAHELGHIVMHDKGDASTREIENQAHDFAASLLFPEEAALRELPRVIDAQGWVRLAQLKQRWGVSMAALLFRAKSLEVLSPHAYTNAMRYMSAHGWRITEPGDREMGTPESPLLISRALRALEIEHGISLADLATEASMPLQDAQELVNAATDDRPSIGV